MKKNGTNVRKDADLREEYKVEKLAMLKDLIDKLKKIIKQISIPKTMMIVKLYGGNLNTVIMDILRLHLKKGNEAMKKTAFLFAIITAGAFLFAADKNIPERPANIPEDAKWIEKWWIYEDNYPMSHYDITWYQNGNLSFLYYDTDDKKYFVSEIYYKNGKIKKRYQSIGNKFLNKNHQGYTGDIVGKVLSYHENGSLKDEICYTLVIEKNNARYTDYEGYSEYELNSTPCGTEIHYDENGNEIQRIEHNVKCEYGCDEAPRLTVEQVIAKIKPKMDVVKNEKYKKLPVVGKVKSINSKSKEIEISYNEGYTLSTGDEVCSLVDGIKLDFVCISNGNGTGIYKLNTDKDKKFASLNKDMDVRFYKKNDIRNEYFTNPKRKPEAGDIETIGGIEFVYIPAGEAMLYNKYDPKKITMAKINAFWLTRYEVTLGEFLKYCYEEEKALPKNGSNVILNSMLPVDVDFNEDYARGYCWWFGKKYGVEARLPEPDEWEYAARAGTDTDFYWGSEKADDYCWYKKNSGNKLHPVGEKRPNAFGLYDMNGNALEWCELRDFHHNEYRYYIRGGSCQSSLRDLKYDRIYAYIYISDYFKDKGIPSPYKEVSKQGTGFRIAISAK